MAKAWNGSPVEFRMAAADQACEVLGVLDDAAAWLQGRGVVQWPARFAMSWITGAIARDETRLVVVGEAIAATVTLNWVDALWSDISGSAGYLHRMAVRRWASGLGGVILDWAGDRARERGCDALRLDCVAANGRLRGYYEMAGFEHRGDVRVATSAAQGLHEPPTAMVSRYELRLSDVSRGAR